MYSSLVVEEFQMLFPSMLLMLGELFSTILITTISVCMALTLCLCSSVINESVKSSSLAFGVRLDPGVRPTSPLNLIINKNFNGDTALNSYCLFSNPSQYSLFSPPPPPPPEFCVSYCFQNDTLRNMQSCQEHLKTVLHVLLDAKLSNFCGFCLDVSYRSRFNWMCHFSHVWKISFAPLIG